MIDLIEAMRQNWNILELAWSLAAVLGIILSSRALARVTSLIRSAFDDGMEWPTRRRLIKRIRDALGAYLRHIGFLIIGIYAMAVPPAPVNPDIDYTPGLATALVFIWVISWDIVSLQWDERDWVSIVKALVQDPTLWKRVIEDEERVQARMAQQIGQELPKQERMCPDHDCGT